jgi:hypothetical protein
MLERRFLDIQLLQLMLREVTDAQIARLCAIALARFELAGQ